jgi:hypothetical protein
MKSERVCLQRETKRNLQKTKSEKEARAIDFSAPFPPFCQSFKSVNQSVTAHTERAAQRP